MPGRIGAKELGESRREGPLTTREREGNPPTRPGDKVPAGEPAHRWLPDRSDTYCGSRDGQATSDDSAVTCEGCLEPMPMRLAAYRVWEVLNSRGNLDILGEALLHIVDNEGDPDRLERIGRLTVPAARARRKADHIRGNEEAEAR